MGSEVTAPLIPKQHQMEAEGEIHVPAALTKVKVPTVSTEEKAVVAAEHVRLEK
jgi:hypothetical protein